MSADVDAAREALLATVQPKPRDAYFRTVDAVAAFEAAVRAESEANRHEPLESVFENGRAHGRAESEAKLAALRARIEAIEPWELPTGEYLDREEVRAALAATPTHRYDHDGEHQWWLCEPPCLPPEAATPAEEEPTYLVGGTSGTNPPPFPPPDKG